MMALIRPFRALRPKKEHGADVASKPYDVISSDEARTEAQDKPLSFLHVIKSEVDLPKETHPYDPKIYAKAKENLERFISDQVLVQEDEPVLFLYRQIWQGRTQTGFGGCFSVREYEKNRIKKHEFTRKDKEDDRVNHILTTGAQTGQVFLAFRSKENTDELIESLTQREVDYDFTDSEEARHLLWIIRNPQEVERIVTFFREIPELYIADGHHRAASSSRVCNIMASKNPKHNGSEEYNFFMAVAFPHTHLKILDYNRIIKGLNGWSFEGLINRITESFTVHAAPHSPYSPQNRHEFGMYCQGKWFCLKGKEAIVDESDPILSLDVAILQNHLLNPVLGIEDPRTDSRISFIGGIRGLKALQDEVDHNADIGFSLFPTSMEELLNVADAEQVMPPKSTWFEPKLKSGLIIHRID
jgi:uncharacterized protein (DUF1015 family)